MIKHMLTRESLCYHMGYGIRLGHCCHEEQVLKGESKSHPVGRNDQVLACRSNVIMISKCFHVKAYCMLLSGTKCYHVK